MRRALIAALAAAAFATFAAPAHAQDAVSAGDAYWHGRFDRVWQSATPGKGKPGNWYTKAPPRGAKTDVPTGAAIFGQGAERTEVWFNRKRDAPDPFVHVNTLFVQRGSPRYFFTVQDKARVVFDAQGFFTRTHRDDAPWITVKPEAVLKFTGAAQISSPGSFSGPSIFVDDGGEVRFEGFSRAGDAGFGIAGRVVFEGESSAGDNYFNLPTPASNTTFPQVLFKDRSSPARARFGILGSASTVDMSATKGPVGDGRLTAKQITLQGGNLRIGDNSLTVSDRLTMQGYLYVEMRKNKIGEVIVEGPVTTNGTLVVELKPVGSYPKSGRYRVLKATEISGGALTLQTPYSAFYLDNDTVPGEIHLVVP